jgi:hypothetical protein
VLQPLLLQFPKQINRENISVNREVLVDIREFTLRPSSDTCYGALTKTVPLTQAAELGNSPERDSPTFAAWHLTILFEGIGRALPNSRGRSG